jgi:hypothetical protein
LANEAGVALMIVSAFECGQKTPIANNRAALRRALEDSGVIFADRTSHGVSLKRRQTGV